MVFEKIQNIELKYTVGITHHMFYKFPKIFEPIIVFAGRSNVGKSSVINSLAGKKIAFISKRPGKTKQINYYFTNSKFFLVDLPGYGYAKVNKYFITEWKNLIEKFFIHHHTIDLIILVIDIRRNFLDSDLKMFEFIKQLNKEFYILLNKCDTLSNQQIIKQTLGYIQTLGIESHKIIPYSAKTGIGKRELFKAFIKNFNEPKIV